MPATLVVVRGGSSTGKTRAAFEAAADRLADWQLNYPLDLGALAERLEAGVPAHTVLWLGELRQYADAGGGAAVLARLADLLQGEGNVVITTMWPEQWNAYAGAARAGPGARSGRDCCPAAGAAAGTDRRRSPGIDPARGGVIDVPARFTAAEIVHCGRRRRPGAGHGRCGCRCWAGWATTEYLAGVPDLLRRDETPAVPYGQAVIAAAMDVVRLGYASPLPAALLQDAAVGYLTGPQRAKAIDTWRDTALAWASEELKGAVRALEPVRLPQAQVWPATRSPTTSTSTPAGLARIS